MKKGLQQNACHPERKRRIFPRKFAETFKEKILRHFVSQNDIKENVLLQPIHRDV